LTPRLRREILASSRQVADQRMEAHSSHKARRATARRLRKNKPNAEIVLICNPRAGGRWKELAGILDSEEAQKVRRIVTDSVEDIAVAVSELGREARMLCIYGGDGTVQRILDRLAASRQDHINLALIGGGTMNVTSRWCGFSRKPAQAFRHVVRGYHSGELLYKDVPILEIETGREFHRGFTFGMGPIVRLLDHYEHGKKGKLAALGTAARAISAAWTNWPASHEPLLAAMNAEVTLDGERLPHDEWTALFANVTGQINPGVEPFIDERGRDDFYCAAYAVSARELTLAMPMLTRGWLPLDLAALLDPSRLRDRASRADPRYINKSGGRLEIRTSETLYTVDGELLPVEGETISVQTGPHLRLAVGPGRVSLPGALDRFT